MSSLEKPESEKKQFNQAVAIPSIIEIPVYSVFDNS